VTYYWRPMSKPASFAWFMVWEGGGSHPNFDVGVSNWVSCGHSEWGEASRFGAGGVERVMPGPSENTFRGGVYQCRAFCGRASDGVSGVGGEVVDA
jgi:hypothetical protein